MSVVRWIQMQRRERKKTHPKAYPDGTHTDLYKHTISPAAIFFCMYNHYGQLNDKKNLHSLLLDSILYWAKKEEKQTKQEGSNNHDEKQTMKKEQQMWCWKEQ